ncbi:hypothetical protein B2M27_23970 [Kluyvera intermedia]|uniref:Uncharacterized protein n=1 Tax=Kluyvera intermedia TaxID=61648 RepID=A0ABX3U942_KLUIN|nr:DUF1378 family protein [Kluyvera intermedia]ORJ47811.1 hypothetical protein B2M27_23970 [Kluyvera intermedia]
MTVYDSFLLYFSSAVSALLLITGGWVKIRDYFKVKAAEKAEEVAAAAKAKADEIEAAVQVRLKQLQAETEAAPDATATSTSGPVVG